MLKFCSRLMSLEYTYSRMLLTSRILKLNHYSANSCSSNVNPDDVKLEIADRKEFSNPQVISILKSVQQFGFEEYEMKLLMNSQPELMKKTPGSWQNVVESLLQSSFDKNDIFTILEKCPEILYIKKDDLYNRLVAWMQVGIGDNMVCEILTAHPHLFNVDSNFLTKRIKQYQLQFESKRRVGKLLLIAPNTLEEDWKIICDKLNYLNDLCMDNSEIVSSGVLAHSLFHIKVRHEFLIRAGVYKRPIKDFHKRLSKNPKLERIVNTTDHEFAVNIAGLSPFEYEVFLEMFEEIYETERESGEIDYDDEVLMNKLNYKK